MLKQIAMEFYYTEHILMRMDERDIAADAVDETIRRGEIITAYADDKPYPSYLYLAFIDGRALHVVAAAKALNSYIIVTAYWPDAAVWMDDFRRKK